MVEYDDKITNTDKIINSVIDIGYWATLHESKENGKSKKEIKNSSVYNDVKSMKHRLIISLIFVICSAYLSGFAQDLFILFKLSFFNYIWLRFSPLCTKYL